MSPITRRSIFASVPLGLLALACSGADPSEMTASESAAIVAKCAPNQHTDCEPEGPRGQMICTCVNNPPPVAALPVQQRIAMAAFTSYATESVFEPFAWGNNAHGQLGNGVIGAPNPNPAAVHGLPLGFPTIIAATIDGACTVSGSSVWCWGEAVKGETGAGYDRADQPPPVKVPFAFGNITQLVADHTHVCALSSGNVVCWGELFWGEVPVREETPTQVFSGAAQVAVGVGHSCVLRARDGAVFCWGNNSSGELGLGPTVASAYDPTQVPGIVARNIYAGGSSTCAQLASDGTFKCWGQDSSSQLGDGFTSNAFVPRAVPGLTGASWLALGRFHSCGIFGSALLDKEVRCWGQNNLAQLGTGAADDLVHTIPVVVPSFAATQVAVGNLNTCAHRNDGSIWCWGDNQFGECGTPSAINSMVTSPHMAVQAF